MGLKFTKMHGLGNDFLVIDGVNQTVNLRSETIRSLSNRHTGVGFDQCLIIEPSDNNNIDFFYRIYNADGSEVGQCGNGARCLARFIKHYGLSDKTTLNVSTTTTTLALTINPDDTVTVNMGVPIFHEDVTIETINLHTLNLGNPHAALIVEDIEKADVNHLGPLIETHAHFKDDTNVEFIKLNVPNNIQLRVHERGAGETRACGSGACAAAAIAKHFYSFDAHINVQLLGGELAIDWEGGDTPLYMTGPATFVYEGTLFD